MISLDFTIKGHPAIFLICLSVSILVSIIWVFKRLSKRKSEKTPEMGEVSPFTGFQKFAIAGIILFMLPLLFMIVSNLGRGMLILFSFILQVLHLPEIFITVSMYIFTTCILAFIFCVTYYFFELMWPKRVYKDGT